MGAPSPRASTAWQGNGDSTWGWWHKGTRSCHEAEAHGGLTLTDLGVETEPCQHQLLSPVPGAAGTTHRDTGLSLPPGIWISWSRALPCWLWHRKPQTPDPETRVPIAGSSHRAGCAREPSTSQCWTLGCSSSVCSPPQKKEKWLGMLQARSLCFRLFSTKRLGNKAHSFPSRESERVNFRKQNLKT